MTDGFRALTRVASLLNEGDEQSARDAYIRFLDAFSGAGQMRDAANALGMRLGLFPYVLPTADGLSESEALALAYHSPQVFEAYGFSFHSEQQRVYERLLDGENVILSAPTSFGKSAVVDALILSNRWLNIVLIVPTIALIDETRRRLVALRTHYTVISHPQQRRGEANIFVMTQERFLELDPPPAVDFFVIDEFYKLGAGEEDNKRRATLNIAWRELRRTGAQYYLIGPNVDHVDVGEDSDLGAMLTVSTFNTVVVDIEDRAHVDDPVEDMRRFLSEEANGPSLVFVSSPRRAGEIAVQLADEAIDDALVDAIADWVGDNYHPEWYVTRALKVGVGTHTGPMPRSLQRAMIRLFEMRKIDRLICTTTLIEGVNTVARNMLILDKKIDRKPIDFFTFSNIRGRAGRMLKHFVGRVISYHEPPLHEEATVDIGIESQSEAASLATLVQLETDELSVTSRERLASVLEQQYLSLGTIKRNKGLDPELQVAAAQRMLESAPEFFARLSWNGMPSSQQLQAVIEVGYDELLVGKERRGDNAKSIMAKLRTVRESDGSIPEMVHRQMQYRHPGQTASEVVDDVLAFQRNWMGFKLPSVMRSVASIQGEVATARGDSSRGNYEFALREIEGLYLPPFIAQLEDYGLPTPLGLKLSRLGLRGDTIEAVVGKLADMARDQRLLGQLSRVERWFLSDVASGLATEMQIARS